MALRGQKEVAVAVAVLRGPPCPPRTNVLPLPFFVVLRGPSWTKGSCSRRCSSPRPSVSSADKCVAVAVLRGPPCPPRTNVLPLPFFVVLRGPSWTNVLPLPFFAALRVLRGQMCCRCSSSRPFVALRGQRCCRFSSPRPSVSSVDKCVAVAVLRGPPWLDQFMIPLISVQTNVNEP